ncbi:hypothetical protein D3C84_845480 [compost metagenome]
MSEAKGSLRNPLASTGAAVAGRPPVQAGMLPLALPSFSAPMGVSFVPSCAASSAGTAAIAAVDRAVREKAPALSQVLIVCISTFLDNVSGPGLAPQLAASHRPSKKDCSWNTLTH